MQIKHISSSYSLSVENQHSCLYLTTEAKNICLMQIKYYLYTIMLSTYSSRILGLQKALSNLVTELWWSLAIHSLLSAISMHEQLSPILSNAALWCLVSAISMHAQC